MSEKQREEMRRPKGFFTIADPPPDEGSDAPLAPRAAQEVAPGARGELCRAVVGMSGTCYLPAGHAGDHDWIRDALPAAEVVPILGTAVPKSGTEPRWKVGDRVCFVNAPLGQVYRVTRVHDDEPRVEVQNSAGIYASHLFVAAPAEPVSLPPLTVEAKDRPIRADFLASLSELGAEAFRDAGYLQEVNREFFHPLGLALAIQGDRFLMLDRRHDLEGIIFDDSSDLRVKADLVEAQRQLRRIPRMEKLGYFVQPPFKI
jgi:hypothetical protein